MVRFLDFHSSLILQMNNYFHLEKKLIQLLQKILALGLFIKKVQFVMTCNQKTIATRA